MVEKILRIPEVDVKRVVITGGPGTGKTSLITALENAGYPVKHEQARIFIDNTNKGLSNLSPWTDLLAFSERVMNARHEDYQGAQFGSFNFYDRGLPDTLAYLRRDGKSIPDDWISLVTSHRYERVVFIAPPWQEIFHQDNERMESYEELLSIHQYLIDTYENLGYELRELPRIPIEERLHFVIKELA